MPLFWKNSKTYKDRLQPDTVLASCPTDEQLELYSLGRMAEPAIASTEEHLLICSHCQDRLNEADEWIGLMKQETARLAAEPARSRWSFLHGWAMSKPLWAGGFAALAVMVGLSLQMSTRPAEFPGQTVQLQATRGVQPETHAARNRLLTLKMDLTELPAAEAYRVEVVDSTGSPVWRGKVKPENRRVEVSLERKLQPGAYWVRLYGGGDEYLREYGLRVD